MAYVNTGADSDTFHIKDKSQLVRVLQGLMADEDGAAALYSRVIDSLKERNDPDDADVIKRLEEIRNDELQHEGSLIECIITLEPNISAQFMKGGNGK